VSNSESKSVPVIKLAFFDKSTGEYYVRDMFGKLEFSTEVDDAKLYATRKAILEYLDYVQYNSKRTLSVVEVEVTRRVVGESNIVSEVNEAKQILFNTLSTQVENDVDAMSEADFKMYKKLKRELQQ
jgi:tetrahydromethanopterin S-methyltransferase subunit H